jgi:hypothetical protein
MILAGGKPTGIFKRIYNFKDGSKVQPTEWLHQYY